MMPKVDIENSEQNAFFPDWLVEWAKEHTVNSFPEYMPEKKYVWKMTKALITG